MDRPRPSSPQRSSSRTFRRGSSDRAARARARGRRAKPPRARTSRPGCPVAHPAPRGSPPTSSAPAGLRRAGRRPAGCECAVGQQRLTGESSARASDRTAAPSRSYGTTASTHYCEPIRSRNLPPRAAAIHVGPTMMGVILTLYRGLRKTTAVPGYKASEIYIRSTYPVNPRSIRGAVHPKFRSDAGRRSRARCDQLWAGAMVTETAI
jgi:hypothetical protein